VLLSIIGVVIGAALNYVFTKFLDERRHRRNLRTKAYLDFCNNNMNAFFVGVTNETKSRYADAAHRIVIYGSKEVVKAMANMKSFNAKNMSESESKSEWERLYVLMIQAMRKDGMTKGSVSDEDISQIIFERGN